jgi:hypothetical protein
MALASAPFGPHTASAVELKEQLEADEYGQPYLLLRDPTEGQKIVVLGDVARVTVGRARSCDVSLHWDHQVSRVHAQLERVGDHWTVVDDGLSRNGTFLNGERLAGRRRLRAGDVLHLGTTPVAFRAPGEAGDSTAGGKLVARPELSEAQRRVLIALCRPYLGGAFHAAPATNRQIAAELFLSLETVKSHVRALFERFGVEDLPQNAKRARLVELAFQSGAVIPRDLEA